MKKVIYIILIGGIFLSSGNVFAKKEVDNKVNPLSKIPVENQIQNNSILLDEEQTQATLKMDSSHVQNSMGSNMMFYFEYNEQGLCVSKTVKYHNNEAWIPFEKELYSYTKGLKSEKEHQYYDLVNKKWYSANKTAYTYNENNQKILEVISSSQDQGVTFTEASKEETTYTKDGQIESTTKNVYNESKWTIYSRNVYKYSDEGLRIAYDYYVGMGSELVLSVKQEYAYNENKMLISEIETYLNGAIFMNNYKYEWEYDSNKRPKIKYIYYGTGQTWDLDKRHEYSYDENGLATVELLHKRQGGEGDLVLSNKVEYLYNSYSLLKSRVSSMYNNEDWTEAANEELEYYEPISMPSVLQSINDTHYLRPLPGVEFIEYLPTEVPTSIPTKVTTNVIDMNYTSTTTIFYSQLKGSTISECANNGNRVYSLPGKIILENGSEKEMTVVYNITGQVAYQGTDKEINLNSGIYLVKTANSTNKVIVY